MTPAEISRFIAVRDNAWQNNSFAALTENRAEDEEVESHCDKDLLT